MFLHLSRSSRRKSAILRVVAYAAGILACSTVALAADQPSCPAVAPHVLNPAEEAYSHSHYEQARQLYTQLLASNPHDAEASAGLVRTLLHQGEIPSAAAQAGRGLTDDPHSAVALAAQAEVQLHQGQPWLALDTLKAAAEVNACYARIPFVRSRVLRIDSMYASERKEVEAAYAIDPNDSDIKHAYLSTIQPAREIEEITKSLATMKDLDAETRKKAEETINSYLPLLSENNQTCQVLPAVIPATLPLQASRQDGKNVDGYRLAVAFPKSSGNFQVDTGSSGLFISRATAEANGFQPAPDGPPGTVLADSVRIGPLEFHNCIAGVSDTPFPGKADGFIGTDIFAQWLITLDQPHSQLILDRLPAQASLLPGDRQEYPELAGFMPVYHRQQYLMVPVTLNNKKRELFVLDSGIRFTTMTSGVAHSISATKVNFTNPIQTVSGSTLQVYRDAFDFQLANLSLTHQSHILEFDPSLIVQNSGMLVAGMLGFDILRSMTIHLDYRDGMVKLETTDQNLLNASSKDAASGLKEPNSPAGEAECGTISTRDIPTRSAMIAVVGGTLDSSHLKPGKEIAFKVPNGWASDECTIAPGALLYGRVVSATIGNHGDSELGLNFDQAECGGYAKKPVSFKLLGVVAAPDQYEAIHGVLPNEVHGAQNISNVQGAMGELADDVNLNPGGPPKTIHPGIVVGLPKIKLNPQGGAGCSAKLTSSERSLRLGTGVELLLSLLVTK